MAGTSLADSMPVPVAAGVAEAAQAAEDADLEIDEDFLRRIREV